MAWRDLRDKVAVQFRGAVESDASILCAAERATTTADFATNPQLSLHLTGDTRRPKRFRTRRNDQHRYGRRQAVAVVNDIRFDLGASACSRDVDAAIAVERRTVSGACFVTVRTCWAMVEPQSQAPAAE